MEQGKQMTSKATRFRSLYVGCIVALVVFPGILFFISIVVGLLTGHLYAFGRRGETLSGPLARIISGIFLIVVVLLLLRVLMTRKKAREQN